MKKEKPNTKEKETDPNLTVQPLAENQMQQKGIIQAPPGTEMKTMVLYKNFKFCENLNEELTLSSGALIRKQIDTVSSSEALNKYYVLFQSKNGLNFVFKGESASNDISSKGLKMNIRHVRSKE